MGYRKLVDKSFKPHRVKALEPYIEELVNMLIDRFIERGECEFVSQFAIPLPLYVIADTIGISRDKAADFKRWSDALMKVHEPGISAELQIELTKVVIEMQRFFAAEYEKALPNPKENILGDLATSQIDGRPVTPQEVVALLSSILVAGNESTASALGNCMRRIIQTPGILATLQGDSSKISAFVEEVLRLDAPLQCQYRRAVKEVELSGQKVPANSMLVLRYGAGNRDESRFPNASQIDLERPQVRNHLTFGRGIHSCLGMQLARAELNVAMRILVTRMTNFRSTAEPEVLPSYMVYGPSKLPIAFDRR
ncbi:MAG TPA: cytochrome P450 [Lacipirellulaceae bacterium]|jgi:cytochrome P450|nr:cytochrome P450 [Lacipirellulaceae bacterium]